MIDEILKKLPTSWNEFKLKDYLKVADVVITEDEDVLNGLENSLKLISALTDIPANELEEYSLADINLIADKISFINKLPEPGKESIIKWKNVETVKYNDFLNFMNLSKEPIKNLALIIQSFSTNEMTEDEALNLSMQECMNGFFLLTSQLKKSVHRSIHSLAVKLKKRKVKVPIMISHSKLNRNK